MSVEATFAEKAEGKPGTRQMHREQWWKVWLAPRPFTIVATLVYIASFMLIQGECPGCPLRGRDFLAAGVYLGLMALDRLDYRLYGETPPVRAGIALLALRVLLLEILMVADVQTAMFAYALLPYIASFYFGVRGAYFLGGLAWIAVVARSTWHHLTNISLLRSSYPGIYEGEYWGEYLNGMAGYTVLVVFVVTAATIVSEEKKSRERAEMLLAELESSHRQLEVQSERALRATEERNRLARAINDSLGHYLTVINVQLEKARAFRSIDAAQADQAVRDAKALASDALQDVRRSVSALRRPEEVALPPFTVATDEVESASTRRTRPRVLKWLAPRPSDIALTVMYLGVLTMDLAWPESRYEIVSWREVTFASIVAIFILMDRLDYFVFGEVPPRGAAAFLMGVRVLLLIVLIVIVGSWYAFWFIPISTYFVFSYYGRQAGYWVGTVSWIALIGMATLVPLVNGMGRFSWGEFAATAGMITMLMAIGVVSARTVLEERAHRARSEELRAGLQEAHGRLQSYSEQALATMQERNHLAREIHDGLGHYLTVINVQLEKALAFRDIDPQAADQAILDSKRLAGEALQDVRVTMGSLQPKHEAFSLRPAVERLAANMAHNLELDMRIDGSEDGFSGQSLITLYRAVQEGLTNIQKHSGAKEARIRIHLGESEASVYLFDNGSGFDPTVLGGERYGLQGVRERLQLIGGSMEVLSKVGAGTALHVTVPRDHLPFAPGQEQPSPVRAQAAAVKV
jgi:signal transduction histidine kinase